MFLIKTRVVPAPHAVPLPEIRRRRPECARSSCLFFDSLPPAARIQGAPGSDFCGERHRGIGHPRTPRLLRVLLGPPLIGSQKLLFQRARVRGIVVVFDVIGLPKSIDFAGFSEIEHFEAVRRSESWNRSKIVTIGIPRFLDTY